MLPTVKSWPFPFSSHQAMLKNTLLERRNEKDLGNTSLACCYYHVVVQSISHVRLFVTPWATAHQASLSITVSQFMSIESRMPSNHLILCHPFLLLPSVFPSIRVFSNELSVCIRWPEYWSFSISQSNEFLGLISLRIGWLDLLDVQGTLKSLLQHHSWKASILQHSAFLMVQFSYYHE